MRALKEAQKDGNKVGSSPSNVGSPSSGSLCLVESCRAFRIDWSGSLSLSCWRSLASALVIVVFAVTVISRTCSSTSSYRLSSNSRFGVSSMWLSTMSCAALKSENFSWSLSLRLMICAVAADAAMARSTAVIALVTRPCWMPRFFFARSSSLTCLPGVFGVRLGGGGGGLFLSPFPPPAPAPAPPPAPAPAPVPAPPPAPAPASGPAVVVSGPVAAAVLSGCFFLAPLFSSLVSLVIFTEFLLLVDEAAESPLKCRFLSPMASSSQLIGPIKIQSLCHY